MAIDRVWNLEVCRAGNHERKREKMKNEIMDNMCHVTLLPFLPGLMLSQRPAKFYLT